MLFFFLMLTFCSCLKNIDEVELNTNPFDADYAFPLAVVEDIIIVDTTLATGTNKCRVYVHFKVDAISLERVRSITNIGNENVNFVLRYRNIKMININLDDIKTDKKYSTVAPLYSTDCGEEICFEFLYEDQITGSPGGTQTNYKASAIQKIDCFIITP